ncbi:MAG: amidohydrolase family protein [Bacteroidales bacterium]|nr:amidohydrolase family protein [Bacteroidales bacterium]
MSLILKNGIYINYSDLEFIAKDVVVSPEKETLDFYDYGEYIPQTGDQVADCSGKYIIHSFVDAFMRPGLSLAPKAKVFTKRETTYFRYVSDILWNIDKVLDKDLVYASALYAAINAARTGTTFAICRNETSKFIDGSLALVDKAFNEVGISTLQSFAACEADGFAAAEKAVNENAAYLSEKQGLMGIAASYLASKELVALVAQKCKERNIGVMINAAEDELDQINTMRDYRRNVVFRLYEAGLMDYQSTILVNANYIGDDERSYIKNKPAWVAHNPIGNFRRGIRPFNSIWLDNILLGSDFSGEGMIDVMKHAFFSSLASDNDLSLSEVYKRLRANNNYVKINNFKGDGENNLIVFDNNSPFELSKENFVKHLVYNSQALETKLVIAKGKIVVKNGHAIQIDEKEALKFIKEQAERISC